MEVFKALFSISKWYIGGGVGVAGAIGVLIYFPLFRKWAIGAIVLIVCALGIYSKGVYDNAVLAKAKSEAQQKATIDSANRARTSAGDAVDGGVCVDPQDSDCKQ